jgi:hydroxyethylthiazole kinase
LVTDGLDVIAVPGGYPLLTKVTGVGCALGALMAACRAVEVGPLAADRLDVALAPGAAGLAMVSAVCAAADPEEATRRIRQAAGWRS